MRPWRALVTLAMARIGTNSFIGYNIRMEDNKNKRNNFDKGEYIRENVHLTRAPRMKGAVQRKGTMNVKKPKQK